MAGEEFTASIDVKNVGELEGTYEAVWKVEGDVDDTHKVTLDSGETRTVTFSMVWNEAGTYDVSLSGMSKTLTVLTPAEFEVSNLTINPSKIESGENVEISASVKNTGGVKGTYEAILKINGNKIDSKEVTTSQGKSTTITFSGTIKNIEPGTYEISIGEEVVNLEILEPAKFEFSNFSVNPSTTSSGKPVDVLIDVRNIGKVSGEYVVKLKVNGNIEKSKSVNLDKGEKHTVSFSITKNPGTYTIKIEGFSSSLEVYEELYRITNVDELQSIKNDLSAHYILTTDIDASETKNWNGGKGFDPIGDSDHPFTGSINGQGFEREC